MKLKNQLIIVALSITILVLVLFFSLLNFSSFQIFPLSNNSDFNIEVFHEGVDTGFSKASAEINTKGALEIKYQLSNNFEEPFTGVYFNKKDSLSPFFDISKFNALRIHLKSEKAKRIPITITYDYEGFSYKQKLFHYVPYTALIEYTGEKKYELKLGDFKQQSWWYRYHQIQPEAFANIDAKRANYFIIGSCQLLGAGGKDQITVSSIEFYNDNLFWITIVVCSLIIVYVVLLIYYFLKKKKEVLVPYIPNEINNNPFNKLDKIVQYISINYSNPELNQEDMQKELGISSREIGSILKEQLNTSFKNYLNQIRLAEVKRLLKESDLPISDCAYKAGYNNISHFNRVFKTETGTSPKQFRES